MQTTPASVWPGKFPFLVSSHDLPIVRGRPTFIRFRGARNKKAANSRGRGDPIIIIILESDWQKGAPLPRPRGHGELVVPGAAVATTPTAARPGQSHTGGGKKGEGRGVAREGRRRRCRGDAVDAVRILIVKLQWRKKEAGLARAWDAPRCRGGGGLGRGRGCWGGKGTLLAVGAVGRAVGSGGPSGGARGASFA